MFSIRFPSVFIVLAAVAVASAAIEYPSNTDLTIVDIKTLDVNTSWEAFLQASGLIQVARSQNVIGPLRYTFGTRDYSKDRIVSQGSGWKSFSMPRNYQLRLDYPSRGNGAVVTFVEINVEQSSKIGKAYILSGGIKERNIEIMVEGNSTTWLKYSYTVYGIYN